MTTSLLWLRMAAARPYFNRPGREASSGHNRTETPGEYELKPGATSSDGISGVWYEKVRSPDHRGLQLSQLRRRCFG